jgi:hypothetical protein
MPYNISTQQLAMLALHVDEMCTLLYIPPQEETVRTLRTKLCLSGGPTHRWFSNYRHYHEHLGAGVAFLRSCGELDDHNAQIEDVRYVITRHSLRSLIPVLAKLGGLRAETRSSGDRDYECLQTAAQNWVNQNHMPLTFLERLGLLQVDVEPLNR